MKSAQQGSGSGNGALGHLDKHCKASNRLETGPVLEELQNDVLFHCFW